MCATVGAFGHSFFVVRIHQYHIGTNQFAANLLMPLRLIQNSMQAIKEENTEITEDDLITKLAEKFDVSKQAMKIHYDAIFKNEQDSP